MKRGTEASGEPRVSRVAGDRRTEAAGPNLRQGVPRLSSEILSKYVLCRLFPVAAHYCLSENMLTDMLVLGHSNIPAAVSMSKPLQRDLCQPGTVRDIRETLPNPAVEIQIKQPRRSTRRDALPDPRPFTAQLSSCPDATIMLSDVVRSAHHMQLLPNLSGPIFAVQ